MWIEFYICLGQTKALFALLMDLYYPKANFIWGSNYDMIGLDFISWGQKLLGREWEGRCVKQILQAGQIFTQKCQLFTIVLILECILYTTLHGIKSLNMFNIGILSRSVFFGFFWNYTAWFWLRSFYLKNLLREGSGLWKNDANINNAL
jgi:hypothetical protein